MVHTYRPGVYSQYKIMPFGRERLGRAAIFCGKAAARPETTEKFPFLATDTERLEEVFPKEQNADLWVVAELMFGCGLDLWVQPVEGEAPEASQYRAALEGTLQISGAGALLCDRGDVPVLEEVKHTVEAAEAAQKEWLAFCHCPMQQAAGTARQLNCPRIVLLCQKAKVDKGGGKALYGAAAMAAAVLLLPWPNQSLNGAAMPGLTETEMLTEDMVEQLLAAGVTVAENVGAEVQCIRGVTTKTSIDGAENRSLFSITTMLMMDDILGSVRSSLQRLLHGLRTDRYTLEAVQTQAAVVLEEKKNCGYVAAYEPPVVKRDRTDPSVCCVILRFAIAAVISQIWLTAEITM